jgi:hypothetical protein
MYRDTANVEHETYDHTSNNCSHRNSNKRFLKKTWKLYQANIQQIQ